MHHSILVLRCLSKRASNRVPNHQNMTIFSTVMNLRLSFVVALLASCTWNEGIAAIIMYKNATTKINFVNRTYYLGQKLDVEVTKNSTRTGSDPNGDFVLAIYPSNGTMGGNKTSWYNVAWNTSSLTQSFDIILTTYIAGWYKIAVVNTSRVRRVLGISDSLLYVDQPFVSINFPKTDYYQGESVKFDIVNPFIDLSYQPGMDFGHSFLLVSVGYPYLYEKKINTTRMGPTVVPYEPGEYKIVLVRDFSSLSHMFGVYWTNEYLSDVPNSTFYVKQNYAKLTNSGTDIRNENVLSLTTTNNIPLIGPFKIQVVAADAVFGKVYFSKNIHQTKSPTAILNTTIIQTKSWPEYWRVRVAYDQGIWTVSTSYLNLERFC